MSNNSAVNIIRGTFLFALFYVVVRYHIVGQVPWSSFPLFIFNKAIALASFILLSFNFSFSPMKNIGIKIPQRWLDARNILGMVGFLLVVIHVFMSFLLFNSSIYSKFFQDDGSLTLLAGISMLGGILAFVSLWTYNMSFQTHLRDDKKFIEFITSRKIMLISLSFGAIHLFMMGYKGWLTPLDWHGGIPPVSLLAFLFFIIGYGANLLGRAK